MLLVVTLAGSGLGWMGLRVREARRQQVAVGALRKLDFNVAYDYECDLKGNYMRNDGPPGPRWLRALFGRRFLQKRSQCRSA